MDISDNNFAFKLLHFKLIKERDSSNPNYTPRPNISSTCWKLNGSNNTNTNNIFIYIVASQCLIQNILTFPGKTSAHLQEKNSRFKEADFSLCVLQDISFRNWKKKSRLLLTKNVLFGLVFTKQATTSLNLSL